LSARRREFIGILGTAAAATALSRREAGGASTLEVPVTGMTRKTYDVAVIGAGCFGAWTAWHFRQAGKSVVLLDKYGPANARASSGGESRVIRMSYGPDELYTRFSFRALGLWKSFFAQTGHPELFQETGVLWMARGEDPAAVASLRTLATVGVKHEKLSHADLDRRFPQIAGDPSGWAIFEPESGALLARRAVQLVTSDAVKGGADLVDAAVLPPAGQGHLAAIRTTSGETVSAGAFVFACGPWLAKVVPDVLDGRIFPSRQEVFFFGVPPGDARFGPPAMPTWIDFGQEYYGIPDLETRGFKVASDSHGPPIDPDTADRVVSPENAARVRAFVGERFPGLKDAPIVETRVCQYENSSNGDFLIDRHPGFDNVWLAGGGSGHGFKHGPAVGEYVADHILKGGPVDPRFSLATKDKVQKRTVH
jgi:sarcosine oxidase